MTDDNTPIDEGHPIYKAIDRGGGQMCNIPGVLRELERAGYVIVKKEPTQEKIAEAIWAMPSAKRVILWSTMPENIKVLWREDAERVMHVMAQ